MKKRTFKYKLPPIVFLVILIIGVFYLFLSHFFENDTFTAPSLMVKTSSELRGIVKMVTIFFWGPLTLLYTAVIISKGIKQKIKFNFNELKSYLTDVLLFLSGLSFVSFLLLSSILDFYNEKNPTFINEKYVHVTNFKREIKTTSGRGGSSSTTYYILSTDSKEHQEIKATDILYSSVREGDSLIIKNYKGRLGYLFSTIEIPTADINQELVHWREKGFKGFLSYKTMIHIVIFFLLCFWFASLAFFLVPKYLLPKGMVKIFSILIIGIVLLQVFCYFFMYDFFYASIVLTVVFLMMLSSVFLAHFFKKLLIHRIKVFCEEKGMLMYYIILGVIYIGILIALSSSLSAIVEADFASRR